MKKTKKVRRVRGDSPADIANDAIIRYRKKRGATLDDLYEWLIDASLSPEEASEMCNLEAENEEMD